MKLFRLPIASDKVIPRPGCGIEDDQLVSRPCEQASAVGSDIASSSPVNADDGSLTHREAPSASSSLRTSSRVLIDEISAITAL